MLNFYELCLKLDETIEGNPAPTHSNQTKNRRVIDHGAHLDKELLDKTPGISSRRDDADYSPDPEPAKNAAEELAGLPGVEGDTARILHKIIVNNPNKYRSGVSLPLAQFVGMLRSEILNDKGMQRIVGNIKPEAILRSIQILARKTSTPLFDLAKSSDGKYSVAFRAFKADPSMVRRPGEAAKQVAMNPAEDQLAKPGAGGRYNSIQNKAGLSQAPMGAPSPAEANMMDGPRKSFEKAFDVAMGTGLGTPLHQAAEAYKAVLSQIIGNANTLPTLRMQYAQAKNAVDQKLQEFIARWQAKNLNPQSEV